MALFLEIVGAVTLVVLAIVVILIVYVMWLVHRAERRDARWRRYQFARRPGPIPSVRGRLPRRISCDLVDPATQSRTSRP